MWSFEDRTHNGNRSLDDLVEHMDKGPLVRRGWSAERGRVPVPVSFVKFRAFNAIPRKSGKGYSDIGLLDLPAGHAGSRLVCQCRAGEGKNVT
jgi:hypothetical protein